MVADFLCRKILSSSAFSQVRTEISTHCDGNFGIEAEVLAAYFRELARVHKPDGVAFLHHSNYGLPALAPSLCAPSASIPATAIQSTTRPRMNWNFQGNDWRAPSVSAARFAELCNQAGLRCVGQELINWAGGVILLDCISVVTLPQSRWDRPNRVVKNRLFRLEARSTRRSLLAYDPDPTRLRP